jgi:hypothetical protein
MEILAKVFCIRISKVEEMIPSRFETQGSKEEGLLASGVLAGGVSFLFPELPPVLSPGLFH